MRENLSGDLASLMARQITSLENIMNKMQKCVMNVQALLDALVKWAQGVTDGVSAFEHHTVKMTRQMDFHSKKQSTGLGTQI